MTMSKKKKMAKLLFDASKRKSLATDLEGEDYSAVVDSVITLRFAPGAVGAKKSIC